MEPVKPDRAAVLLFTRSPAAEERAKRLPKRRGGARALLSAWRQLFASALGQRCPAVDLVVVGPACDDELPAGARFVAQRGDSFHERLANAFTDVRSLGFEQVVAIPGDLPTLTVADVEAALEAIAGDRVCLGPAVDGGVYLVGLRGDAGELLRGVRWCTPHVLVDLRSRAATLGRIVVSLRRQRDIDAAVDLHALLAVPVERHLRRLLEHLLCVIESTDSVIDPPSPAAVAACGPRAPPALLVVT